MDITHGRGVNVVLNSLAGETFLKTMQIVAPLGRFIEIGKRDIVENTRLPMLPFNKNLSFSGIDLISVVQEKIQLIQALSVPPYTKRFQPEVRTDTISVSSYRYCDCLGQWQHQSTLAKSSSRSKAGSCLIVPSPRTLHLKPMHELLITGDIGELDGSGDSMGARRPPSGPCRADDQRSGAGTLRRWRRVSVEGDAF